MLIFFCSALFLRDDGGDYFSLHTTQHLFHSRLKCIIAININYLLICSPILPFYQRKFSVNFSPWCAFPYEARNFFCSDLLTILNVCTQRTVFDATLISFFLSCCRIGGKISLNFCAHTHWQPSGMLFHQKTLHRIALDSMKFRYMANVKQVCLSHSLSDTFTVL